MTTITLVQASAHGANQIHQMTAQPMNVVITGLQGGNIQYSCTNVLGTLRGAQFVEITYDASVRGNPHERVNVSSVIL